MIGALSAPRAAALSLLVFMVVCPGDGAGAAVLRPSAGTATLQATVDVALPGDVVEVPPGVWKGPVVIRRAITLRGEGGIIDGGGEGTVLRVAAAGVVVTGLRVLSSGKDLGGPDACIFVEKAATGARLQDNHVEDCGFGIWVHETKGAQIKGNRVVGSLTGHRSNRGNGIHLFNASELVVLDNHVTGGRDGIYVSATEDSLIERNRMSETRYGIHYMFSYRNKVRFNEARSNTNGMALMESHHLDVRANVATDNAERGLLVRDVQYTAIIGNRLERNGEGLFMYSSTENDIRDNVIRQNLIGARIWAGSVRNDVRDNSFVGNRTQVFYVAATDLEWGVEGPGNYWGDYLGWDQDGDGVGDRPYRVDSFKSRLTYQYPAAGLLLRSPALELLSHLEQRVAVLRVPTVVDRRPRARRPADVAR